MDVWRVQHRSREGQNSGSERVLDAFGAAGHSLNFPEVIGDRLGGVLGSSWGHLGRVLGASWLRFGKSETVFGASWGQLGGI